MTTPVSQDCAGLVPGGRIDVETIEDGGDWSSLGDAAALVQRAANGVVSAIEISGAVQSVAVALSADDQVAALNRDYRGKAKPTNVLSFPAGPGASDGFLGDIILAQETVAREADEQGIALASHVQHLVVHGILHLLGYDHETAAEAERMETLEIAILAELGIENPYTGELDPAP